MPEPRVRAINFRVFVVGGAQNNILFLILAGMRVNCNSVVLLALLDARCAADDEETSC